MVDRHKAIRALARRMAAEPADAPGPRPPAARIPLPRSHEADLTASRTHRLSLTSSVVDAERFAVALGRAAACHEALRLGPVRDSGRWFLGPVPDPVVRVDRVAELDWADPAHPLRWALLTQPGQVTVTLAVSAWLVDRSCWGAILATIGSAYNGARASSRPTELDYGDYCYWLAHRTQPDPAAGRRFAQEIGHPATDPYWTFAAGQSWAVRPGDAPASWTPREPAVVGLAADLAAGLRACGWRGSGIRIQRWQARPPEAPIVGRVDEPEVANLRAGSGAAAPAPTAAIVDALDPWWESSAEPLVHVDVDVLDLPPLTFDGEPVRMEPLLSPSPGWQCVLVRQATGARIHLGGPQSTLPAIQAALAGNPAANCDIEVAAPRVRGAGVPAPRIVTPQRALPAEVVAGAVDQRAAQLRAAGARPGSPVILECAAGPETVANLIAALTCRADVLLVDLDDPPAWREGLVARLAGAVLVSRDNTVQPAVPPICTTVGDGEGALLLGISSSPAIPVLARIPLPDLLRGAAALAELWRLAAGDAVAVDPARAADDLALKVLTCALSGAEVRVVSGLDGADAVELLGQTRSIVDANLAEDWAVPQHRLSDAQRVRRGTETTVDAVTGWWVAEAADAQWVATEQGLRLRSGSVRVVDESGRSMPDGAVGELSVAMSGGCRYSGDPRRTADRLRPSAAGGRELRTGVLVGRIGQASQVLRFPPDRTVHRNRTCLTDAWQIVRDSTFVGVQQPGMPAPERLFVVSPRRVDTGGLPAPLASAELCVDEPANDLDEDSAWRIVRARGERTSHAPDENWVISKEKALANEVAEEILGFRLGPHEDMFSRGATSLQLMRMLLQVKERAGVEISLARFFAAPTVARLADLIDGAADASSAALELIDEITGESP